MSIVTSTKELLKAIGIWKLALVGVALIAMLAAVRFFPVLDWIKAFGQWSAQLGFAGAVIYGVVFGIAAILMVPCLPLTIFAGFAFGMFSGLVAVWIGIAVGAAFGFLFARYVARDAVSQRLAQNTRFRAIDGAIAKEGWKIVGLLRMCPVPFGITNYLYGLTAIKFWPYMAATMVGLLPPNIAFVYLGAFGKRTLDGPRHPLEFVLGGLALVALLGVMFILRRIAQRATAGQLQASG
ncbi:MAG TPA: TVP38/TMEM64 family protein [Chthoniobacterales bacterium]|nr:TVP38/TMEM64 family protein [Chthoniobacterales bacterium]